MALLVRGVRVGVLGLAIAGMLAGCSGGGGSSAAGDWDRIEQGRATHATRIGAIERLWEQTESADWSRRATVREAAKQMAWDRDAPESVRYRVVTLLLSDDRPEADADNRGLVRLLLPTEPSRAIVAECARAAADRGWSEVSDGLVRRLATDDAERTAIDQRIEAVALRGLNGGASLDEVLYRHFVAPPEPAGIAPALDWRGRVRADAWVSLVRMDASGRTARRLLERPTPPDADEEATRTVEDLRAASRDLEALPETSATFRWLRAMRRPEHAAWWAEAARAVTSVAPSSRVGLRLRHVEPIRWAAANRPGWLAWDRARLLDEARARLADRETFLRSGDLGRVDRKRSRERLDDWAGVMSWADLLTLLVVDEALASADVAAQLRAFTIADRKDKQTEYGGLIEATAEGWRARLFPPRERDRTSDNDFVAGEDLIAASDRALAHYHLQVQSTRNRAYAGPSPGDLRYAEQSGRTALVFTSVGGERLNADYYQPDGVVIDLGAVRLDGDAAGG